MKADYEFSAESGCVNKEADASDELNETIGLTQRPDDLIEYKS